MRLKTDPKNQNSLHLCYIKSKQYRFHLPSGTYGGAGKNTSFKNSFTNRCIFDLTIDKNTKKVNLLSKTRNIEELTFNEKLYFKKL